jgi:hypothetical protein
LSSFWLILKQKCHDLLELSLRYATHRLMVIHPHTNHHWHISKDKNVMARTRKYYLKNNYFTLRSRSNEGHYGMRQRLMVMHPHTNYHWPISKDKNVMTRTRKFYLKKLFWPWGQRSRSHEGHYGTWNTSLWSCTHIRNIINLSRKTKKLWSGQASLRSGWKKSDSNNMSPFVRRGDIISWKLSHSFMLMCLIYFEVFSGIWKSFPKPCRICIKFALHHH